MSVVYFIESGVGGPVKIGVSTKLEMRMEALRCSNPEPIALLGEVPGSFKLERVMHRWLRIASIRGEWFKRAESVELLNAVEGLSEAEAIGLLESAIAARNSLSAARTVQIKHEVRKAFQHACLKHGREAVRAAVGYTKMGFGKILKGQSMPGAHAVFTLLTFDESALDAAFAIGINSQRIDLAIHKASGAWIEQCAVIRGERAVA